MRYKNYAMPATLEEAWTLNQKKSSRILGGTLWLRMSPLSFNTAIDLSGLGLDRIEDLGGEVRIGCMTSLHDIEVSDTLNSLCGSAAREALRSIVGVQFRNCATLGGSLYPRFGFSDVLTLFMALDADVELFKAGRMPICEFAARSHGRDILTHVIVKKRPMRVCYLSQRNSKTDFPVLTCAVSEVEGRMFGCVGARPMRAVRFERTADMSDGEFAEYVQNSATFGSNMRASAEYRRHIAGVLVRRGCAAIRRDGK